MKSLIPAFAPFTAALMLSSVAAAQNYGDAPAPYPTAEHTDCDEHFGATCLADTSNPVTPPWTGSTDDDGVTFTGLVKGSDATLTVILGKAYLADDLAVWIDWNNDGDWDDAGEQVVWLGGTSSPGATTGPLEFLDNTFTIPIPADAAGDSAKLRARVWYPPDASGAFVGDGGGAPDGVTEWGEVEDYSFPYYGDPEIDVQRPAANSISSGASDDLGLLLPGSPSQVTWTIENLGATQALSLAGGVTTSSPLNCTASVTTAPAASVAAGASTSFVIDITATATGPWSFDLSIASNDADENPYTIAVSGIATDAMSGSFLISNDAGESPDFASLGEAFDALEANGQAGPILFEISEGTGPYATDDTYALSDVASVGAPSTITIRPEAGEHPVLDGSGATIDFDAVGTLAITNTPFVTIEGLEVTGGADFGIAVLDTGSSVTSDIAILGCWIHGVTAGNGIYIAGDSTSIDNVSIVNNMIWDVVIGDNLMVGYGEGAIGFFNVGANTVIQHNTVVVNSGVSGGADVLLNHAGGGSAISNLSYNIFVAATSGFGLIAIEGTALPAFADYNIYFLTGGATTFGPDDTNLAAWQSRSGVDANSLATDPALHDITPGSEDLHLTGGSTNAIDGAVGSTVDVDIDGESRPDGAAADIGADERGAAAPDAPILAVTADGVTVNDGATIDVDLDDTVASAVLSFTVTDLDLGDTLTLATTVTDSADIDSFVQAEWNATGTGGTITATPATGTFDTAGSITVALAADDGTGLTDALTFTIVVHAPVTADPIIAVTADGVAVADGATVDVDLDDTVASAVLSFTVTDDDTGDTLTLATTVTDSADIDSFVQAEWNATGTGGTITATPATGTFDTAGSITVALAADDGTGLTDALTFTIVVHAPANVDPVLAVTTDGTAITNGGTVNATVGDTLASLALVFTVTDTDTDQTLDLVTTVTNQAALNGFVSAEWNATGTGGTITASPTTGTLDTAGTISVSLAADDNEGGTATLAFTISVSAPDNQLPVLDAPTATGEITNGGSDPSFTGTVEIGGDIGLSFGATDADATDTLTISIAVSGGTLSAAQAGFAETFPHSPAGSVSPHSVALTGTAGAAGTIQLTVTAADDNGGADSYTYTLTITDGGDDGGGGCCQTGKSSNELPGSALIVLFAFLFDSARRRRRRRI